MTNPYPIEAAALISFSGGRTSGHRGTAVMEHKTYLTAFWRGMSQKLEVVQRQHRRRIP
jgi:hypothetical protein